jgi:hypothetical protein
VITGEGERRVGQKQQLCYLVTIPEFGDGVAFHIVKNNFRVEVAPEAVFASEVITVDHTAPPPVDTVFTSQTNVLPNVFGGTGLREEIAQLRAEGIEVDDDNEPLPEDAIPAPADPEGMRYEYTTPTYCPDGQTTTLSIIAGGGCITGGTRLRRNPNWISSACACPRISSVRSFSLPPTCICSLT